MSDELTQHFGLGMFPPIEIVWNEKELLLELRGKMFAGTEEKPFLIQLHGPAAIQALQSFRTLLARVDVDALEGETPRSLQ